MTRLILTTAMALAIALCVYAPVIAYAASFLEALR